MKNGKAKRILKNFKLRSQLAADLERFSLRLGKTQTRIVEEALAARFALKIRR